LFAIFADNIRAIRQGARLIMRKTIVSGVVAIAFAVTLASAAVLLKTTPASSEDFCFGYAVCDQAPSR